MPETNKRDMGAVQHQDTNSQRADRGAVELSISEVPMFTRLSPMATPGKRYSFSAKTAAPTSTRRIFMIT